MRLIATLVAKPKCAKRLLEEIPEDSIILFPESVNLKIALVKKYSKDKNLSAHTVCYRDRLVLD